MSNIKVIVHSWTHKPKNMPANYAEPGIGDMIRGTIKLWQLSKVMGFRLFVDLSAHPVGEFFAPPPHPYSELIRKDEIAFVPAHSLENTLLNHLDKEFLFFVTNDFCDEEVIAEECKSFLREVLTPKPNVVEYVGQLLAGSQIMEGFEVLHYRLGDSELLEGKADPEIIRRALHNISLHRNEKTLLLSDSNLLRILGRSIARTIPDKVAHTGYTAESDALKSTIAELLLLTKAKSIKTFSTYGHISGFAYWAHRLYDVPLYIIDSLDTNTLRVPEHMYADNRWKDITQREKKIARQKFYAHFGIASLL